MLTVNKNSIAVSVIQGTRSKAMWNGPVVHMYPQCLYLLHTFFWIQTFIKFPGGFALLQLRVTLQLGFNVVLCIQIVRNVPDRGSSSTHTLRPFPACSSATPKHLFTAPMSALQEPLIPLTSAVTQSSPPMLSPAPALCPVLAWVPCSLLGPPQPSSARCFYGHTCLLFWRTKIAFYTCPEIKGSCKSLELGKV